MYFYVYIPKQGRHIHDTRLFESDKDALEYIDKITHRVEGVLVELAPSCTCDKKVYCGNLHIGDLLYRKVGG